MGLFSLATSKRQSSGAPDLGAVRDTLGFHGVSRDHIKRVVDAFEEHGHRGTEAVLDHLRAQPETDRLSDRHLAKVVEAFKKHL